MEVNDLQSDQFQILRVGEVIRVLCAKFQLPSTSLVQGAHCTKFMLKICRSDPPPFTVDIHSLLLMHSQGYIFSKKYTPGGGNKDLCLGKQFKKN